MVGTLITVAKDVKIQVEWNPARVAAMNETELRARATEVQTAVQELGGYTFQRMELGKSVVFRHQGGKA